MRRTGSTKRRPVAIQQIVVFCFTFFRFTALSCRLFAVQEYRDFFFLGSAFTSSEGGYEYTTLCCRHSYR